MVKMPQGNLNDDEQTQQLPYHILFVFHDFLLVWRLKICLESPSVSCKEILYTSINTEEQQSCSHFNFWLLEMSPWIDFNFLFHEGHLRAKHKTQTFFFRYDHGLFWGSEEIHFRCETTHPSEASELYLGLKEIGAYPGLVNASLFVNYPSHMIYHWASHDTKTRNCR